MTTINVIGNGLAGVTGSGLHVGQTSPTLITPILGVSSATSVNFGVDALGNYNKRTAWTPVFSFVTPGNLVLSATTTVAWYLRIGDLVTLSWDYTFTPTFTTSSGNAFLSGMPFSSVAGQGVIASCPISYSATYSPPAFFIGLSVNLTGSSNLIGITNNLSASGSNPATITNFPTGASQVLRGLMQYYAA